MKESVNKLQHRKEDKKRLTLIFVALIYFVVEPSGAHSNSWDIQQWKSFFLTLDSPVTAEVYVRQFEEALSHLDTQDAEFVAAHILNHLRNTNYGLHLKINHEQAIRLYRLVAKLPGVDILNTQLSKRRFFFGSSVERFDSKIVQKVLSRLFSIAFPEGMKSIVHPQNLAKLHADFVAEIPAPMKDMVFYEILRRFEHQEIAREIPDPMAIDRLSRELNLSPGQQGELLRRLVSSYYPLRDHQLFSRYLHAEIAKNIGTSNQSTEALLMTIGSRPHELDELIKFQKIHHANPEMKLHLLYQLHSLRSWIEKKARYEDAVELWKLSAQLERETPSIDIDKVKLPSIWLGELAFMTAPNFKSAAQALTSPHWAHETRSEKKERLERSYPKLLLKLHSFQQFKKAASDEPLLAQPEIIFSEAAYQLRKKNIDQLMSAIDEPQPINALALTSSRRHIEFLKVLRAYGISGLEFHSTPAHSAAYFLEKVALVTIENPETLLTHIEILQADDFNPPVAKAAILEIAHYLPDLLEVSDSAHLRQLAEANALLARIQHEAEIVTVARKNREIIIGELLRQNKSPKGFLQYFAVGILRSPTEQPTLARENIEQAWQMADQHFNRLTSNPLASPTEMKAVALEMNSLMNDGESPFVQSLDVLTVVGAAQRSILEFDKIDSRVSEQLQTQLRIAQDTSETKSDNETEMANVMRVYQTVYILRLLNEKNANHGVTELLLSETTASTAPIDFSFRTEFGKAIKRALALGTINLAELTNEQRAGLAKWIETHSPQEFISLSRPKLITKLYAHCSMVLRKIQAELH